MDRARCSAQEFLFYPLNFFQFFGLVRFNPRTRQKSIIKSIFMVALMVYLVVEFGINMFLLVHLRQPFTKVQFLRTCSDSVFFGSETITAFLSVLTSYLHFKKKLSTIDTLCHVDELMHQIGIRLRYNKGWWKPKIIIVVGGLAFWLIIDIIAFFICSPEHISVILCIRYSAGLIYWADICYLLTVLKIIAKHFEKLNQQWVKLTKTFETNSYYQGGQLPERIKILIQVHSLLRKLCKIQSYLYGWQLAFLTISFLTKIVSFTYLIISRDIAYFIGEDYESNLVVYNGYFGSSIMLYFVLCFSVLHVVVNTRDEVGKFNDMYILSLVRKNISPPVLTKFVG
ncbi:hypothetical protein V9T40_012349 [Parthenolecanium corni]|uniref:Uncharacterized protein n=1 Tax=Parthenolecanium corni TaxID=536013 RepID=A0AAN9Y0F8_9HEMI